MLITFSGLDGAGKSTLIARLRRALQAEGRRVTVLTMYDDVGFYAFLRAVRDRTAGGLRRLRGQAPPALVSNDPDRLGVPQARRGPLMSLLFWIVRHPRTKRVVYCFDLLLVVTRLARERTPGGVLIMDRYFYDSLADVADDDGWRYIHGFLRALPVPDVPVFVDVAPEAAFQRKGEYSIEYLRRRQDAYRHIFGRVPHAVIVKNDDLELAYRSLEDAVTRRMMTR